MRYENYKASNWRALYIQIARWCNQPQFFKKKSFRQFCEANQDYHKGKNTLCSSYQIMQDFESAFPEIANEYFDLRFDEENQYRYGYGYGRKYANKQSCSACTEQQLTWDKAFQGEIPISDVIQKYFLKEMDLQCFLYPEIACKHYSIEAIADWFCSTLLSIPLDVVLGAIQGSHSKEDVLPSNIPQFSSFPDAYSVTPKILFLSGQSITYDELGTYLDNGKDKTEIAKRKYGENHSKLATLLDLAVIFSDSNSYKIGLSILGAAFVKRSDEEKRAVVARLLFRVPIIQKILTNAIANEVNIESELQCLSRQTMIRRRPNIAAMINFIHDSVSEDDKALISALKNIGGWR